MVEWLEPATLIVYVILLLLGLFLCLKQRFMIEFTFLLIILFAKLINMYFLRYTKLMVNGEIPMPENVDIDKLINVIEQSTQLIELIAFVIFIFGLYRRWKRA